MSKPIKTCNCCGYPLIDDDTALGLTRAQLRMFKLIRRSGTAGITRADLMDAMYTNDITGGPESPNILNVHRVHMNKRLEAHGLTVASSGGWYSLWRVEKVATIEAPSLVPTHAEMVA